MTKNKNLLPSIILATGIIIASFIYAYSHRYEFVYRQSSNGVIILVDKWKLETVVIASEHRIIKD